MADVCSMANPISQLNLLAQEIGGLYPYRAVIRDLAKAQDQLSDSWRADSSLPPVNILNNWLKDSGYLRDVTLVDSHIQNRATQKENGGPAAHYVTTIAVRREIPTRSGNLHDFANALTWAAFPQSKSVLFDLLHKDYQSFLSQTSIPQAGRGRSRFGDLLTGLDEAGAIHLRETGNSLSIWFGHAIIENLLLTRGPVSIPTWVLDYPATGHALPHSLPEFFAQAGPDLDSFVATALYSRLTSEHPSSNGCSCVGHPSCLNAELQP